MRRQVFEVTKSLSAHKIMSGANIFCDALAKHLRALREGLEGIFDVFSAEKTKNPGSRKKLAAASF